MKRGRPPKPAKERRDVVLCHRLTKAEYSKLGEKAKLAGLSVQEYGREQLLAGVVPKLVPLSSLAKPTLEMFRRPITEYEKLLSEIVRMIAENSKRTGELERALRTLLRKLGLGGSVH